MRWELIKWEKEHGYKGKYVAEKLGLARSTWSNIKNGRARPTYETLQKFEEEFKPTNVLELFKNEGE